MHRRQTKLSSVLKYLSIDYSDDSKSIVPLDSNFFPSASPLEIVAVLVPIASK